LMSGWKPALERLERATVSVILARTMARFGEESRGSPKSSSRLADLVTDPLGLSVQERWRRSGTAIAQAKAVLEDDMSGRIWGTRFGAERW